MSYHIAIKNASIIQFTYAVIINISHIIIKIKYLTKVIWNTFVFKKRYKNNRGIHIKIIILKIILTYKSIYIKKYFQVILKFKKANFILPFIASNGSLFSKITKYFAYIDEKLKNIIKNSHININVITIKLFNISTT